MLLRAEAWHKKCIGWTRMDFKRLRFRKQLKRYDISGDAHFLTFSCYRRQQFLLGERECHWLAESLREGCRRHEMSLWGYVFMPEHVHLLVHPNEPVYDTARFMQAVKLSTTNKVQAFRRGCDLPETAWEPYLDIQPNGLVHFRFWQRGGGYDENVRDEGALTSILEYMHNNPVKRGLCDVPMDWVWSSARAFAGVGDGPLKVDIELT